MYGAYLGGPLPALLSVAKQPAPPVRKARDLVVVLLVLFIGVLLLVAALGYDALRDGAERDRLRPRPLRRLADNVRFGGGGACGLALRGPCRRCLCGGRGRRVPAALRGRRGALAADQRVAGAARRRLGAVPAPPAGPVRGALLGRSGHAVHLVGACCVAPLALLQPAARRGRRAVVLCGRVGHLGVNLCELLAARRVRVVLALDGGRRCGQLKRVARLGSDPIRRRWLAAALHNGRRCHDPPDRGVDGWCGDSRPRGSAARGSSDGVRVRCRTPHTLHTPLPPEQTPHRHGGAREEAEAGPFRRPGAARVRLRRLAAAQPARLAARRRRGPHRKVRRHAAGKGPPDRARHVGRHHRAAGAQHGPLRGQLLGRHARRRLDRALPARGLRRRVPAPPALAAALLAPLLALAPLLPRLHVRRQGRARGGAARVRRGDADGAGGVQAGAGAGAAAHGAVRHRAVVPALSARDRARPGKGGLLGLALPRRGRQRLLHSPGRNGGAQDPVQRRRPRAPPRSRPQVPQAPRRRMVPRRLRHLLQARDGPGARGAQGPRGAGQVRAPARGGQHAHEPQEGRHARDGRGREGAAHVGRGAGKGARDRGEADTGVHRGARRVDQGPEGVSGRAAGGAGARDGRGVNGTGLVLICCFFILQLQMMIANTAEPCPQALCLVSPAPSLGLRVGLHLGRCDQVAPDGADRPGAQRGRLAGNGIELGEEVGDLVDGFGLNPVRSGCGSGLGDLLLHGGRRRRGLRFRVHGFGLLLRLLRGGRLRRRGNRNRFGHRLGHIGHGLDGGCLLLRLLDLRLRFGRRRLRNDLSNGLLLLLLLLRRKNLRRLGCCLSVRLACGLDGHLHLVHDGSGRLLGDVRARRGADDVGLGLHDGGSLLDHDGFDLGLRLRLGGACRGEGPQVRL